MNLATNSKMARLMGAVDQLAEASAKYEAGEIDHRELRRAYDAVAQAQAETGLKWKLEYRG